jgi:hypothetical protein
VPFGGRSAGVDGWHLDVFLGGTGRNQVITLEHKTERFAAQPGQFIGVESGDVFTGETVFTAGRAVEAAEDIHQCRLAGAGCADDGDELASMNRQIDAAQYFHQRAVIAAVGFANLPQVNQWGLHSASAAGGWCAEDVIAFDQAFKDLCAQAVADAGAHFTRLDFAVGGDDLRPLPLRA